MVAGQMLGPYRVLEKVGEGGMGEVYKARDTRLDRTVAIKILPPELATDPDLRARFEREARAVAALDHPHICAIYDVGDAVVEFDSPESVTLESPNRQPSSPQFRSPQSPSPQPQAPSPVRFLVMPFLDGETLAARLARTKGPLPIEQALKIAIEIADALDKAHRAGITHRDLKPANIMLVKSGGSARPTATLLDFGLAKLRGPAAPISMSGMTRLATPTPQTATGTILGTVHYMAPEQVEGHEVDARADIWALGVVVYEMLTGRRPFDGTSAASVIGAILKDTPRPIAERRPLTPAAVERIVGRCLTKDPEERWQSARDLAWELAEVDTAPAIGPKKTSGPSRMLTTAIAGGLIVGAAAVWLATNAGVTRTAPLAVVEHASRVTHESLFSEWPTWSPDGRMFAFSSNRAGDYEIYVRRVEGGQEINVTNHPSDDVQPAFSPDGNTIAFVSTRSSATGLVKIGTFVGFNTRTFGGDVWIAPALGGSARRIAEDGNFPVWEPSGRALLYVTGIENQRQIVRAPIDGGPAMKVLPAEASRWEIIRLGASPNGRWITFETSDREVFAVPSSGSGSPKLLLEGTSHAWDGSSRRLFYVVQEADASTRIEAADLADDGTGLRTTRVTVADVSVGMLKDLAVSADGRRVLAVSNEESVNLTRAPLSAAGDAVTGPEEELSDGTVRDRYPVVSPDGRRIAVGSNRTGEDQLWVVDVAARRWDAVHMPEREAGWVTQACWARDSLHLIAMRYASDGTSAFWSVALDGSSAKQILPPRRALAGSFACDVSPDTRHMVYTRVANGFNQLFVLDLATGEDRQFTTSPSHKYAAAWSPDGRWVAYSANTGGTVHVWRMRADGGSAEEQLTTGRERNTHLFYSPDGRWIYINPSHHNIARLPAAGGPPQPVTHFPEKGLFIEEPTISADGRWLVYGRGKGGASVWLLTIGTR